VGKIIQSIILGSGVRPFYGSSKVRSGIQRLLPLNPLFSENCSPAITVVMPCHSKDFQILPLAALGVLKHSQNKVERIVVIHEENTRKSLDKEFNSLPIEFIPEDQVIDEEIRNVVSELMPRERYGWVIQQIATWEFILSQTQEYFLSLNADTIMTKGRTFFSSEKQLLFPVTEYSRDYDIGLASIGIDYRSGLSFVSHHQPIKKSILDNIVGDLDRHEFYRNWMSGTEVSRATISEYHTYGNFILSKEKEKVVLAYWGNLRIENNSLIELIAQYGNHETLKKLESINNKIFSLSAHHYVKKGDIDPRQAF